MSVQAEKEEIMEKCRRRLAILNEMRQQREMCDGLLRTPSGTEFPVHRPIMASCSNYFMALFTTPIHHDSRRDITIPGTTKKTLEWLVEYAYTRKVPVTEDNVEELLPIADQFNVIGVLNSCCQFLMEHISAENCIGIRQFAKAYFCSDLESKAYNYVLYNFEEVFRNSEEMRSLPIQEIVEILNDDRLNVKSEGRVWEALQRWVSFDCASRLQHMPQLLSCVRLGLLDERFFTDFIMNHRYVFQNPACERYFHQREMFFRDMERLGEMDHEVVTPQFAMPRIPHDILFTYGGWSSGSSSNVLEAYDIRSDRWSQITVPDPQGPRAYHKLAVIGYDIYVIGGFNGIQYFNSCRRFNVVTKDWNEIAPMHIRRCYVSVAIASGMLYAIGGHDGYTRQNTAERYDPGNNQWTLLPTMYYKRSDASACTLNGRIYVVGGFTGTSILSSAEFYDPCWDVWTRISPMGSQRSGLSCVSYQNYMYVLGGFNGNVRLRTIERYCPSSNRWAKMPSMYDPRSNFAAEVLEDNIFVMGGYNGGTTVSDVECYSHETKLWKKATDLIVHRSALAACVVRQVPNAAHYAYQHRELLLEEKRRRIRGMTIASVRIDDEDEGDDEDDEGIDDDDVVVVAQQPPQGNQPPQLAPIQPAHEEEGEAIVPNIFENLFR